MTSLPAASTEMPACSHECQLQAPGATEKRYQLLMSGNRWGGDETEGALELIDAGSFLAD